MAEEHFAALQPQCCNIITPENSPPPLHPLTSVNTTNMTCTPVLSVVGEGEGGGGGYEILEYGKTVVFSFKAVCPTKRFFPEAGVFFPNGSDTFFFKTPGASRVLSVFFTLSAKRSGVFFQLG